VVQPVGTVTLVFTDVEGSTRLLSELGQERYRQALADHRVCVREAFARFRGYEVNYEGDAFFYAFASAVDAVEAVSAALTALAAGPIRVRVGVHTGEPGLDRPKYVGLDVHRAARIMAAAHGGQVLLSQASRELVGARFGLRDLGEQRLRDLPEPERLFQLGEEDFPPLRTFAQTNLPLPATAFLGRERELAEVTRLLRDGARMLTLTGTAGTGKTRLALRTAAEVAAGFADGVWWLPLAPLREAALVAGELARVIGVVDQPGRELTETLAAALEARRQLVVVDNAEHLLPQLARTLGRLAAVEGPTFLITSRERLHLAGEHVYPVPPLVDREAIELFTVRARALDPAFKPSAAVAQVCARLDNLPLALELAAVRTHLLSPEQILERLAQRLDLLKADGEADPRQQTLRAAIAWSHDLLDPAQRRLFARLSVFSGGCTLAAAETVCGAELDTLASLLDKSLLRRSGDRYWMLETIRQYATEQLERSGETEQIEDALSRWCLQLAARSDPELRSDARTASTALLAAEQPNLRLAIDVLLSRGQPDEALMLIAAHGLYWWWRGDAGEEARARIEAALALDSASPPWLARVLFWGSFLWNYWNDRNVPTRLGRRALELFRLLGDELWSGRTLLTLGDQHLSRGDLAAAEKLYFEALSLSRAAEDVWALANEANRFGMVAGERGDRERARACFEESRDLFRRDGDLMGVATETANLGWVELESGNLDRAGSLVLEALESLVELQSLGQLPSILDTLARIHLGRGSETQAARSLGVRAAIIRATGRQTEPITAMGVAETEANVIQAFGKERFHVELGAASELHLHDAIEATLTLARDAAPAPPMTSAPGTSAAALREAPPKGLQATVVSPNGSSRRSSSPNAQ
jgi:predicted ATPase